MARKRARKSAVKTVNLKPSLEVTDSTSVFYINFAEVSQTQHDYALSATRLPSKLSAARLEAAQSSGGTLSFEATVQLIIPFTLMRGLIQALETTEKNRNALVEAGKGTKH